MLHPGESIGRLGGGSRLDAPPTPEKQSAHVPVGIRACFESVTWIVDYRNQREIDGKPSVKLDGEGGSIKFAPLETLRLQSIEWL